MKLIYVIFYMTKINFLNFIQEKLTQTILMVQVVPSHQQLQQIYQKGTLVYSDFNRISGNISKKLSHKLVMRGNCILCNIVFVGKKIKTYKRKILNNIPDSKHMAGVSIVNGVLLLKVLAKDISDIRLFLEKLFYVFDKNFNVPKLWSS